MLAIDWRRKEDCFHEYMHLGMICKWTQDCKVHTSVSSNSAMRNFYIHIYKEREVHGKISQKMKRKNGGTP